MRRTLLFLVALVDSRARARARVSRPHPAVRNPEPQTL